MYVFMCVCMCMCLWVFVRACVSPSVPQMVYQLCVPVLSVRSAYKMFDTDNEISSKTAGQNYRH